MSHTDFDALPLEVRLYAVHRHGTGPTTPDRAMEPYEWENLPLATKRRWRAVVMYLKAIQETAA